MSVFTLLFILPVFALASADADIDALISLARAEPLLFMKRAGKLADLSRLSAPEFAAEDELFVALSGRSPDLLVTVDKLDASGTHLRLSALLKVLETADLARRKAFSGDDSFAAFKATYLRSAVILGDAFTRALIDPVRDDSDDLLMRAGRLYVWSEKSVAAAIKALSLIHARVMLLEAAYRHVEFNSSAVDLAASRRAEASIEAVAARGHEVMVRAHKMNTEALNEDLRRWQMRGSKMSHCAFVRATRAWLEERFPGLSFFVAAYDAVSGLNSEHAFEVCDSPGTVSSHVFGVGGRNSIVVGVEKSKMRPGFEKWARQALGKVEGRKASHRFALSALWSVEKAVGGGCQREAARMVVRSGVRSCVSAQEGRAVSGKVTVKECLTRLCWIIKRSRQFEATLFG